MTFPSAKTFAREYDVSAEQTLYDFHRFVQNELDYDEAQPVLFHTADNKWKFGRGFSLTGVRNTELMDEVSIGSIVRSNCYRMLYTFDVLNKRSFRLELLEMLEAEPRKRYPSLEFEQGDTPGQIGKTNSKLSAIFDQAMPDFDDSIYSAGSGDD
jgi:hypothetical protein